MPLLTKRYITNVKFILTFKIVIPVKCNRYHHLNLPDCKVTSKSKSCSYCVVVNKTAYLFYNVYGNDPSVLCKILNKKKCFNVKERKTTLFFHDIAFKLLHFKD